MAALFDALTLVPDDGRDAEAGRETVLLDLRTELAARLVVFPTLMSPLTVPPDVLIVLLVVLPAIVLFLSVSARRP